MNNINSSQIRVLHEDGSIGQIVGIIKGYKGAEKYRNTVIGFVNGNIPVEIFTNLSKHQWSLFCHGLLTEQELEKYI